MTAIAGCIGLAAVTLLSGCQTTNASIPYEVSTENVVAIQSGLQTKKVSVSNITLADGVSEHLMCRMNGDVIVSPGKTLSQYVKDAFQKELFTAQAYDVHGAKIEGRIEELSFSSVTPASWTITMRVHSSASKGYSVSIKYPFETSWIAMEACKNTANAFAPAVQALLKEVVTNPQFPTLAGS
ncbi:hypothetical protein EVC45_35945 [Paraburkholderia sp. UYCP14C]|uniref:hypothetical protein n=1 Tax=Paraburkholderia sp. UYCP14C TaxID=2511130 RepID=UPI0010200ECA|nr:hypothetical protein [Paraburkholderia sp. UYCP14C]RZF24952.1 hypothetical protein EVC45_35945 [Paraburkholderia sp. UYCP14C]